MKHLITREGPGVVGHGGHLYVIGGRGSGGSVEKYDPNTNTWHVLDIKVGDDRASVSTNESCRLATADQLQALKKLLKHPY